jgi:hypothetical protein
MQPYETDKLVHVFAALGATKESAVHHREHREHGQSEGIWPQPRRIETQTVLLNVLPLLEQLNLPMTQHFSKRLAQEVEHLPIVSIITEADNIREMLEQELKQRKFFALHLEHGKYYNNPLLAGERFKDNWPRANNELVEAGNCFALDRYTACVCHSMRALEYALKAFEFSLKIIPAPPGPGNTWGAIIGRIEDRKGRKGYNVSGHPTVPATRPSVEWTANADFNDNCLTFFSAVKSACRDKTFHVESSYDEGAARQMFDCTLVVLSKIAEQLNELN